MGKVGTNGTRNGRGRSGLTRRSTLTPRQTKMNAKSVPMFVRSASSPIFVTIAMTPTMTPVQIVVTCGVRNRGWIFAKYVGSKPSAVSNTARHHDLDGSHCWRHRDGDK